MTDARLALFGGTPTVDRIAHRRWPIVGDAERDAVLGVLERGVLSGASAPESVAFEQEFGRFVEAKHALLTHSGTSALHLALAAAGVRAGDHVIVPAYSFVATPLAVLHCGAIPIFADVDDATGLIDPADVARRVGSRTRAVMPVHVHGCALDLDPLLALGRDRGLAIIEDAAQAHGARWRGRAVGAIGTAGGFSLQSSKNLGVGEGGVFVTNDDALAEEAVRMRSFGQEVTLADRDAFDAMRPLDASRAVASRRVGWMYRGTELASALGRSMLARLPERTAACQANAELLSRALGELAGVLPPTIPPGSTSVHHKYRVRLDPARAGVDIPRRVFRDVVAQALRAEGLEVVAWQTDPLPAQPVFREREGFGNGWPWTQDRETDFDAAYDPSTFPATQRLLDGSVVLFSQSCPLIAQERGMVVRYAEAFARIWKHREELCARAARG
ncbi:MAG TPA: DegT/DnrJ/EryC1/StrS family aminotransferase [Labilithrix sp.]